MMKKSLPLLLLTVLFLGSCMSSKDYVIESDYSYHGKFKKYKSFTFMTTEMGARDTIADRQIIEDAIAYRLDLQGYKKTDKKPNLLVSYKIFFTDLEYRGYAQPNIDNWLRTEDEEEAYRPINYEMRKGTLLISMFDRKQKYTVWQGYVSGLFGGSGLKSKRNLKRAVRSIFDRYRFLAEGYDINAKAR